MFEALIKKLEDEELASLVGKRSTEPVIEVDINDL
jgi:hypothetical protein